VLRPVVIAILCVGGLEDGRLSGGVLLLLLLLFGSLLLVALRLFSHFRFCIYYLNKIAPIIFKT
jgi:hypothetical protein